VIAPATVIASPANRQARFDELLRIAALVAFATLVYWPSLGVPFAFDDLPNIVLNPRVQPTSLSELWQVLDARDGRDDRPLAMLSFALNHLWGGLDPTSYHAVNIAIHAGNGVLLYLLLKGLAAAPHSPPGLKEQIAAFAFAGALLWLVHPVNTQAVTYIVQRMTSLAATCYLIAMLLFVLYRSGRLTRTRAGVGIVLAFAAGLATKPHVITLPAALLLIDIAFFRGLARVHVLGLAAAVALAALVGALVAPDILAHLFHAPPHRDFSGYERVLTQGRVVSHYLSLLAWPDAARLQVDYDVAVSRSLLTPPATAVAWAALVGITAAAIAGLRRWVWPAFGWLFFCIALSVESSFVLLEMAFEHRIYLPATLLIAALLAPLQASARGTRARSALALGVLLLAGALSLQTLERNGAWRDLGGLWRSDLARGAKPFRAALNGAIGLARQGRAEEALALLSKAAPSSRRSERGRVSQLRGEILFMLGRHAEALEAFREALSYYPGWTRAVYSAAQCLIALGRREDAQQIARQLAEQVPDAVFSAVLDAELALDRGHAARAERRLREYLAAHAPGGVTAKNFARLHLAHVLRTRGRHIEAADQYRDIVRDDPKNFGAWASLYHMLQAGGDAAQAARVRHYLEQHNVDLNAWTPTGGSAVTPDLALPPPAP
jgi:tetratricopeptide (TPR) repeat protein